MARGKKRSPAKRKGGHPAKASAARRAEPPPELEIPDELGQVCVHCWKTAHDDDHEPARARGAVTQKCCVCGRRTKSGIIVHVGEFAATLKTAQEPAA